MVLKTWYLPLFWWIQDVRSHIGRECVFRASSLTISLFSDNRDILLSRTIPELISLRDTDLDQLSRAVLAETERRASTPIKLSSSPYCESVTLQTAHDERSFSVEDLVRRRQDNLQHDRWTRKDDSLQVWQSAGSPGWPYHSRHKA